MTLLIEISFYCACILCCSGWSDGITKTGTRAVEGWTIACDPKVFPMGTILDIDGLGERMCLDIGGAIKGLHVDVFMGHDGHAHRRALEKRRRVGVRAVVVHRGGES